MNSDSARGRPQSARPIRFSLLKSCLRNLRAARANKKKKSEAGGGRGTVLAHWRGLYPCTVRSQSSAALQEQLVRASRAGQALSCAKARPMLLAASQRAFWLRPPAISRRDMMTGGGSAVKRLIFSITAAGAAIAGGSGDERMRFYNNKRR